MIDNDYIQQKLCSVIDWCGNQMIFIHISYDIQLSGQTQTVAKQVEEDKYQIQMDRLARSERAAVWKIGKLAKSSLLVLNKNGGNDDPNLSQTLRRSFQIS